MKVNNLNRFQVNPVDTDQIRSRLGRSYSRTQTFLTGKLVPIYVKEVLPNETLKLDFSSLVRSITPAVPTMDNAFIDYFFFFVPNRLCTAGATDWQKVCGENTGGYWAPTTEATLVSTGNTINIKDLGSSQVGSTYYKIAPQSLLNYLGAPVLESSRTPSASNDKSGIINTLACRAYYKIWDDWFRDENTQSPHNYVAGDLGKPFSVKNVNKFHDIFTSSLQSPQKGQSVMLPLGTTAPVLTSLNAHSVSGNVLTFSKKGGSQTFTNSLNIGVGPSSDESNDAALTAFKPATTGDVATGLGKAVGYDGITEATDPADSGFLIPNNLYADLSHATAATVNELRNAFAIQRLLEKDARGGKPIYCLL